MFILEGFWAEVGGAIVDALRSLMLSLCEIIYKLIVFFFNIFMKLGSAEILTEPILEEFYNRIGLILGLFVIFRVVFSLIQYVINPDLMMDKQNGLFNIVKRIFVVVILLGITRPMFRFAYEAQELIIESNVIPNVITGKNIDSADAGSTLAWYSFSSFYKFDDIYVSATPANELLLKCPELYSGVIERDFKKNNTLRYAYNCINVRYDYVDTDSAINSNEEYTSYVIDFTGNGVVALLVGALILWMIVTYSIQVGIRILQLSYLQLIAPAPIIMYLDPKSDTLKKWWKQCVTTYLDFFIRVAVLYFTIFIIQLLIGIDDDTFIKSLGEVTESQQNWITIIMILALLIFVSRVPKLLKELFPSSGGAASFDFGLNPKKVFNDTLAARAIGATVGAVGAGASNAVHGYMNMRKAWKNNGVTMKKWNDLTDAERKSFKNDKKRYNSLRNEQIWKRFGATAGAGVKGAFSIAGGQIGGAMAGLKTKDITKSGEAIKTANKNRENRELKAEAGYHWYNPLPAIEDKILEFSGDKTADEIKNRQKAMVDAKKWDERLRKGEQIYKYVGGDLEDKTNDKKEVKAGVFKNSEYIETWNKQNLAKSKVKEAKSIVDQMQRAATAAYNDFSGTEEDRQYRIKVAEQRLSNAAKNLSAAEGELEIAKGKHQKNQELFPDDKEIENLFNEYANTHKEPVKINKGVDDISRPDNPTSPTDDSSSIDTDDNESGNNNEHSVASNVANNKQSDFSKKSLFSLRRMRDSLESKDRNPQEDDELKKIQAEISKREGAN